VHAATAVETSSTAAMPAATVLRKYRHGEAGKQKDHDRLEGCGK
jgi:hypothetical protein